MSIDGFREASLVRDLLAAIAERCRPGASYRLMEFCGGHTHAFHRFGLVDQLPPAIELIHGPGCPVCVLPISRIEQAIRLAVDEQVILCTYGDMMRVPGVKGRSLLSARSAGADVRMVTSPIDVIEIAAAHPEREVVFLAIGFETTTPPTAVLLKQLAQQEITNVSVLCNHVLTPAAMVQVLRGPAVRDQELVQIDGFIGPAHVSTVIGSDAFSFFASEYRKPVVIAGFEPVDLLQAVAMLIDQLNEGRFDVENQFHRAVRPAGNQIAQALMQETLQLRPQFRWRGLGEVPYSALGIREAYQNFDAEVRFPCPEPAAKEHPACRCPEIIRGAAKPSDCTLFGTACTPAKPIGSCMVSGEGACAAWHRYRRRESVA